MENAPDQLQWLEFDLLKPFDHVVQGVFTRHGGVSSGNYTSLNISNDVGDHPDSVKVNRERMKKAFDVNHIVFPRQMHGTEIVRITKNNFQKIHSVDALYTTEKNIALGVANADCQSVILFDPDHDAIAVVHVGWKGNVQNILAKVVMTFQNEIHSDPKKLLVCISPSLGPCHAEMKNYKQELPQEFWSYQKNPHYFDFWAISEMQLLKSGIDPQNIEIARICSYCQGKDYYSHRRDAKTGRNGTVVLLRE